MDEGWVTTRARRRAGVLGALLGLAMLAACSGGTESPEPAPLPESGPLTRLLDIVVADEPVSDQMAVEEIAARCMAEQGFEYTPVDTSLSYADELTEPAFATGTREYAQEYGFGVTTDPQGFIAAGREWWLNDRDTEQVDPNAAYLASISEAEQQAYAITLWGEPTDTDPDMLDWEHQGCQGRARHEVEVTSAWQDTAGAQSLSEGFNAAIEQTAADPRVADVNHEWASCMTDGGYPGFERVEDAAASIIDAFNAANETAAAVGQDPTEAEVRASWARIDEAVEELQPREIALALADVDCRERVGYEQAVAAVQAEYEQEFYDAHRTELEATLQAFLESQAEADAGG